MIFTPESRFVYQTGSEFVWLPGSYTEQFSSRFQQISTVSVSTDQFSFPATPATFGSSSFTKNVRLVANTRSEIAISSKDVLVAGFEYDRDSTETHSWQIQTAHHSLCRVTPTRSSRKIVGMPGNRLFLSTGVRVDSILTDALPADEENSGQAIYPRYLRNESESANFRGLSGTASRGAGCWE